MKHLKVFCSWVKETGSRLWTYLLGQTELDEKITAAVDETQRRVANVVEEAKDVVDAAKGK
jgi:type II secretory pathway predicted ATPase ExeA